MKTVCQESMCTGCSACVDICSSKAITLVDSLKSINAVIDEAKCINCGMCEKICQNNGHVELQSPRYWYQGWANDKNIRANSTSGGFATAIEKAFIQSGGKVCSCMFDNGQFLFKIVDNVDAIDAFAGSKYVKSNPSGSYKSIRQELLQGKKVLFVGLPCQVAALKKFVGNKLQERLFTVDLICHGTPSSKILEAFLNQHKLSLNAITDVKFRIKGGASNYEEYQSVTTKGVWDNYTIAFLGTIPFTENCYHCRYAKIDRVSDITLGDSWGSSLSRSESEQGLSLALVQTEKGKELIEQADIHLLPVDLSRAVENNHQLRAPSNSPEGRDCFFEDIAKGKSFRLLVMKNFPKTYLKQCLKTVLIKLKIIHQERINSYCIQFKQKDEV